MTHNRCRCFRLRSAIVSQRKIVQPMAGRIGSQRTKKQNLEYHNTMKTLIENFPNNLIQALEIAEKNPLSKSYPPIRQAQGSAFSNILICGLGGSGIGGKLVANWLYNDLDLTVALCQDYDLPKYVNNKTLVIASSYSGDTEETLSAVEQAHNKGAYIVAVTSGGKLAEFCKKHNYEYILVPGGNPPRTQLAFSIVQLTHIFAQLGMIKADRLEEFSKAADLLESDKETIHNEAKNLAGFIHGKDLIIYSDAKDEAIAIRARQQFNENSKILCSHHVIPEMNHNELVGWAGGNENHAVLFLHTGNVHEQNQKRFDYSRLVVQTKTKHIFDLSTNNGSSIMRSLHLIHIIDWASYYLAEQTNVDAIEIGVIINLKNSLV
jgi:glucose/mannose-6-phosphate isomerase